MSESEVRSPWSSFEQARAAIEAIEPGQARSADLRRMRIDPYTSPNVTLLTFSDIVLRFPIGSPFQKLDPGLRQCLEAGKNCSGYSVNIREVKRNRVSGFWEDTFGFKRVVAINGWSFNALVLLVDDRVVYTLYGGQPQLQEQETSRQPLGPLQNFGDAVGGLLK